MRFLHLGDLHIGKTLGEFDLIEDQRFILNQVVDIIKEKGVEGVLLAGDIYDRAVPSEAASRLLDEFLQSLEEMQVSVYMISGNHDSDERLNFGSSFFESHGIHISSVFNGSLYKHTLTDEYGEMNVYLLPFVKASQVRRFYPDSEINSYEDAVMTIIQNAEIDESKRNIIAAHQFVNGKNADPEMGGSERTSLQNVGLVEKIGYNTFDSFDYVALGHIHSAQGVGREQVRYSGSLLKYSLSEIHNEKSVPIITFGEKGTVDIELVPLKPQRDMRQIKGPLASLVKAENVVNPDDFIYAILTDEDIVNDAMSILQTVYPNTIKITYENSHTQEDTMVDITQLGENKPFDEVISEFYKMMYGCDMSDDEMKVMMEVAREVGVIDETN